jgi:hypothetical protein
MRDTTMPDTTMPDTTMPDTTMRKEGAACGRQVMTNETGVCDTSSTHISSIVERERPPRAAQEVMRRVKQRYDPTGTLTPGRYIGHI